MGRQQSAKQKAHRAALKAQSVAQVRARAATPKPLKKAASWWLAGASPDAPREVFRNAATSRDEEMRFDAQWQRPAHLQQIGIL